MDTKFGNFDSFRQVLGESVAMNGLFISQLSNPTKSRIIKGKAPLPLKWSQLGGAKAGRNPLHAPER
jgi:hypothetical protein